MFEDELKHGGFERLREEHRRGHSFEELAKQEGVPLPSLRAALHARGLRNDGAKLSLETRQALLLEYGKRQGARLADLAARHDVASPTVVLNFLGSRGIDTALAFQFSEQDLRRMEELYLAGMGTHEIADVFSQERDEEIHHHTVGERLRDRGVQLSGYTARHPHDSPSAGSILLDGGWERDVAVYLDRLVDRGEVLRWQHEALAIPYVQRGKARTYVPDFFIEWADRAPEVWEVKGRWWSGTDLKLEAAKAEGHVVLVINQAAMPAIWDEVLPTWDWDWMAS